MSPAVNPVAVSLNVAGKLIGELEVGSVCPPACSIATSGFVVSFETVDDTDVGVIGTDSAPSPTALIAYLADGVCVITDWSASASSTSTTSVHAVESCAAIVDVPSVRLAWVVPVGATRPAG